MAGMGPVEHCWHMTLFSSMLAPPMSSGTESYKSLEEFGNSGSESQTRFLLKQTYSPSSRILEAPLQPGQFCKCTVTLKLQKAYRFFSSRELKILTLLMLSTSISLLPVVRLAWQVFVFQKSCRTYSTRGSIRPN